MYSGIINAAQNKKVRRVKLAHSLPAPPRLIVENGAFSAMRKTNSTTAAGAITTILEAMVLFIFRASERRTRQSVIAPHTPFPAPMSLSNPETDPPASCDLSRDAKRQILPGQGWR